MLTAEAGNQASPMGRPLTHRDCLAYAPHGAMLLGICRPMVQVRRSHPTGAYTLCGQVAELSNDSDTGAEWFKVETPIGPVWALGKALRMCSGDGRCHCEPAPDEPDGTTGPASASIGGKGSTGRASTGINQPTGTAAPGSADV
ncbi:hypothetical protein AQPW35_54500 [Rubrivivax pictus]|uniref:Uncharacterized protein n=2 Tax=Pseudaquabacterium pictum TaxID=2315236 RepID=A0A480AXB7_9BURK|nr:hypothetical protein AQPW35_54500 [Rubrivivax pictus]